MFGVIMQTAMGQIEYIRDSLLDALDFVAAVQAHPSYRGQTVAIYARN